MFESNSPEQKLKSVFGRDISEEEKKIFDELYNEYKKKTQGDRDYVILNYRRNPDKEEVVEAMVRIFI